MAAICKPAISNVEFLSRGYLCLLKQNPGCGNYSAHAEVFWNHYTTELLAGDSYPSLTAVTFESSLDTT